MGSNCLKSKSSRSRDPRHIERGASTAGEENVDYRIRKVSSLIPISGIWLDCGCADGGYAAALLDAGATQVIGTDVEPDRIAAARRRWSHLPALRFEVGAAEALPFSDASFDGVFMNEVLEHVDDEGRSLNEIRRVLRPGGALALMSPNRFFPFEGHGLRIGDHRMNMPIPFLPWLPGAIGRRFMRARNYWPWELAGLVRSSRFDVIAKEPVFPVFEVYPWLPDRLLRWYSANLNRIERIPLLRQFGVSTLVAARKPARDC